MEYLESIRYQKFKLDGKVRRGLHIQVADHYGVVLGETGWVDYSAPNQPKTARLKCDGKFAIFVHQKNRNNPKIDTGTDLLRLVIQSLIMYPSQYDTLLILDVDSETIRFYLTALNTLLADKTINAKPTVSSADQSFRLRIPIRQ